MFFILFSLLIAPFSQAQTPAEENYKILGRGVRNSMTGEVLQLACIGTPKAGDLEASCERMQFLYSAMGRPAALIGEPFSLKLLEDTQKFVSTRKFRAALKEQILEIQKSSYARSNGSPFEEYFPMTNSRFGKGGSIGMGMFAIVNIAVWTPVLILAGGPNTVIAGISIGIIGLALIYPFLTDLLALPVRLVIRSMVSKGLNDSSGSKNEFANRDLKYWQQRAEPISHRGFRTLFIGVSDTDNLVHTDASDLCAITRVEYNPFQSWLQSVRDNEERGSIIGIHYPVSGMFLNHYSRRNPFRNPDQSLRNRAKAESEFDKYFRAQLRKFYYITDDTKNGYTFTLFQHVRMKSVNWSDENTGKIKAYCFDYEIKRNSDQQVVFAKRNVCDKSAVVLTGKFLNRLPSCQKLKDARELTNEERIELTPPAQPEVRKQKVW